MLKKAKGNPFIFTKGAITPEEHSANRSFAAYKAGGDNQLESCEKEYAELKEELDYLYKSYEIAIEVLDTEHNAVIRGIFEEIENEMFDIYGGILKCREGTWEKAYKDWQALKQKYGGK